MTTDLGANSGAHNSNLPLNWSNEVNLMNEVLARADSWEQHSGRHPREHEFAQQMVIARAQRSARLAERIAAYAVRRANSRRERAEKLASGLR